MTIGERIKYFREKTGLNQVQLASLTGLHPVTLRKYETNKMLPHQPQIQKIAEAVGVSPNAIWGLDHSNLQLETVGDLMGILYMLLETNHLRILGERADDEFLKPETITLHIEHPIILNELIKWEKMNEMYNRVINGKTETSEDVYNAIVERMKELKEGVSLESQRSSVVLNPKDKK